MSTALLHGTRATAGRGLRLQDVEVRFGPRPGLDNISFTVAPGEHLVLLGPSGAGKTTLLRGVAGLDQLVAGNVYVNDRDITKLKPERRGVVYLHQTPSLFPHLSVLDNIGFPLEMRGVRRADARAKAHELLGQMQLAGYAARNASALSGGQRHRVALARALAAEPAVLLLDEPFAALDPGLRAEVRDSVVEMLRSEGEPASQPSVVIVTHDVDEASLLGDRIAVLLDGRLVQEGAPSVLLSKPATVEVARFLGIPNVLPGVANGREFECALGVFQSDCERGFAAMISRADGIVAVPTVETSSYASDRVTIGGEVSGVIHKIGGTLVSVSVNSSAGAAVVLSTPARDLELRRGVQCKLIVHPERVHIVSMSAPAPEHVPHRVAS